MDAMSKRKILVAIITIETVGSGKPEETQVVLNHLIDGMIGETQINIKGLEFKGDKLVVGLRRGTRKEVSREQARRKNSAQKGEDLRLEITSQRFLLYVTVVDKPCPRIEL